ncbi:uncharacterized protein LOC127115929 [Lathyrus oleraceus]|uniref:uncharacterized protein LOC127115927 n=1 Tax=Pisum sativum TaxID=3888 RepID=UPI0021D3325F|nr:uncharacterized protein LOC127115927 [Pisum sativum]XP_050903299.1 uncharacterized protein LOC127115929 [Pisum sativum]
MEDERVLKVRIECRSFWESGENRSNPMIGNDRSLYSTIPRANWRIKYESSSWHLSEREVCAGFSLHQDFLIWLCESGSVWLHGDLALWRTHLPFSIDFVYGILCSVADTQRSIIPAA